eukprot:4740803-Pleurochrysis_carterae.AAC.1
MRALALQAALQARLPARSFWPCDGAPDGVQDRDRRLWRPRLAAASGGRPCAGGGARGGGTAERRE